MESLEDLVHQMETQMDRADSKLDLLTVRLNQFEAKVIHPSGDADNLSYQESSQNINTEVQEIKENGEEEPDDSGLDPKFLTEILSEVHRVKKEYKQVLQDVHQVQELQQEVTRSLRKQMKQVQNHFDRLRDRVIGSSGSNALPAQK
ncbi:Anamorsin-like protein [Frankliniella fusca]|uniref:Anamorsin-like protein n=1 Tax=Frankliniella fusca TaxID=407009 RepID=A0AAE1LI79_9NEOP|nr:Anamorsin-like protein [Frankliniella fusca]